MESIYGPAASFHDDGSFNESPVVISSYALQLEIDSIGRCISFSVLPEPVCDLSV